MQVIHTKSKIISAIIILALSVIAYNLCKIPITASAETYDTTFSIQNETYLNVAIPSSVVLNITPTAAGQFAKTSMDISVDTNNATGYTLTMTADTTSLSRTSAVNGVDYTIPTLSTTATCTDESDTTCDTFPVGYWGYKFTNAEVADTNTYSPMTTTASPIRFLKEFKNTTDTTTVTFGTKLSNSIPNGTYDGVNLTFSATTTYVIPETAKYMQDFNAVIADSLTPSITYATKDSRDNQDYTVAKLADGNVWMTKNLNLAGGTTIHNTDSNISTESFTIPLESDNIASGSINIYNSNSNNCASETGCYSYYSFPIALGVKGHTLNSSMLNYNICSKKWTIPKRNYYESLINLYKNPESLINAANFVLSGNYGADMILREAGQKGEYWAASLYSNNSAGGFFAISNTETAVNSSNITDGRPIRCVYDRSMQNFSATDAAAMSEGQTITLVDSRDNKEYKVTKINGRVWMTQNLAFTGTQLTPQDSNVSANTTMTYYSLDSSDDSYADHCKDANGYNYACIKDSGNTTAGVWYNFAAASAGTITGSSNTATSTSSLCPSGWQVPTRLILLTVANQIQSFSPVTGGYMFNGAISNAELGSFLASDAGGTIVDQQRNALVYSSIGNNLYANAVNRRAGSYIRCIFSGE